MPLARFDDDLPERDKSRAHLDLQTSGPPPKRVRPPLKPDPDFACIVCGCYIDLPTAWFVGGVALCPICRRTFRAEKVLAYVDAFLRPEVASVRSSHHGLLFWRPRGEILTDNILSWMTLLPGDLAWQLLGIDAFILPVPDRIEPDVALDQNLTCRLRRVLPDRPIADTLPV